MIKKVFFGGFHTILPKLAEFLCFFSLNRPVVKYPELSDESDIFDFRLKRLFRPNGLISLWWWWLVDWSLLVVELVSVWSLLLLLLPLVVVVDSWPKLVVEDWLVLRWLSLFLFFFPFTTAVDGKFCRISGLKSIDDGSISAVLLPLDDPFRLFKCSLLARLLLLVLITSPLLRLDVDRPLWSRFFGFIFCKNENILSSFVRIGADFCYYYLRFLHLFKHL